MFIITSKIRQPKINFKNGDLRFYRSQKDKLLEIEKKLFSIISFRNS